MKKVVVSSMAVMLAFSLAACSSGGGSKNSPSPDTSTTPGASAPAEKPKELKLKIGLPGGYAVTNEDIIKGFQDKYPNVKVEIDDSPWGDFVAKIATQISGGTAPDIWLQENAVVLGYGEKGAAEDLTDFVNGLNKDDYIDPLFAATGVDGKVYGVPHGINPAALAYNKKVFEEANVPFPTDDWTFNDLIENAKKLTDKDKGVYGLVGTASITQGWFPFIKMAGGQALDETKTKSKFDDPKTADGLAAIQTGIKEGYFSDLEFNKTNGGDVPVLAEGKAAMYILQYSNQVTLNKNFPDTDWDVVKIPKSVDGGRYVPMVTNSWIVYSRAKDDAKEAAKLFLEYYLSEEVQNILADSGASIPVNKKSIAYLETIDSKPANKKAFTEGIAESGVTLDENGSWNEWRGAAQKYITDIVNDQMSVEEAVKQIHTEVQKILDEQ